MSCSCSGVRRNETVIGVIPLPMSRWCGSASPAVSRRSRSFRALRPAVTTHLCATSATKTPLGHARGISTHWLRHTTLPWVERHPATTLPAPMPAAPTPPAQPPPPVNAQVSDAKIPVLRLSPGGGPESSRAHGEPSGGGSMSLTWAFTFLWGAIPFSRWGRGSRSASCSRRVSRRRPLMSMSAPAQAHPCSWYDRAGGACAQVSPAVLGSNRSSGRRRWGHWSGPGRSEVAEQRRRYEDYDPGPRGVDRQVAGLPALEGHEGRVPADNPQQ